MGDEFSCHTVGRRRLGRSTSAPGGTLLNRVAHPPLSIVLLIVIALTWSAFPAFAETGSSRDRASDSSRNSPRTSASRPKRVDRFDVVVIDAGHGGHDDGAKGASGLLEKDLVLDVARRLSKRLEKRGIRVVLTRTGDRFLSLEERTAVANDARADLFLSIHANASRSRKPRGVETFFASLDATDEAARATAELENKALGASAPQARRQDPLAAILGDLIENQHLQESSEFSKLAQRKLVDADQSQSRGVKQAPFVVLMGVQMPASLVEIGFLSNPKEEAGLRSGGRRESIAAALADAVQDFAERYDARRGVARRFGVSPNAAR